MSDSTPHAGSGAAQDTPAWDAVLRAAASRLSAAGVDAPRVDAELLLAHVLGVGRGTAVARVFAGARGTVEEGHAYAALLARRVAREPLQHITGRAPFHGIELEVGPGVFVPRPETELLVDLGIAALTAPRDSPGAVGSAAAAAVPGVSGSGGEPQRVVDLCTGSGAVAAAVAAWANGAGRALAITAVELDDEAHAWATRNLAPYGVDLRQDDALVAGEDLAGTVDVLLSNPPYVPDAELPEQPEARVDPARALYGGDARGLRIPLGILDRAAALLRPGGTVAMEHHETQGEELTRAARASGAFVDVRVHRDHAGRDRVLTAVRTRARSRGPHQVEQWPP